MGVIGYPSLGSVRREGVRVRAVLQQAVDVLQQFVTVLPKRVRVGEEVVVVAPEHGEVARFDDDHVPSRIEMGCERVREVAGVSSRRLDHPSRERCASRRWQFRNAHRDAERFEHSHRGFSAFDVNVVRSGIGVEDGLLLRHVGLVDSLV